LGALLQVGTGFHPELTGRENIYLNGAILGMRRREIDRQFEAIVDFAEVERFLDTPVKRYSSGMYMRLAFAVAAHLEPEILIVDEVLAVGDASFQRKCLGKMGEIGKAGRTILFVSHNLVALQRLCSRALWLEGGRVIEDGDPSDIVARYLHNLSTASTERVWEGPDAPGCDQVTLRRMSIRPLGGSPTDVVTMRTPLEVEVEFENRVDGVDLDTTLLFYTEQDVVAFGSSTLEARGGRSLPPGRYRNTCLVPGRLLNTGTYRIALLIVRDGNTILWRQDDGLTVEVKEDERRRSGSWLGKWAGAVRPALEWRVEAMSGAAESLAPASR
jgi:lipopolysaccharide transport system ATP-binding protein